MKDLNSKMILSICMSIVLTWLLSFVAFADTNQLPEKERYIVIENYDDFFQDKGNSIIIEEFYLKNIFEDESSKPVFVSVNDLSGVNQFYIKTSSDKNVNQRTCYLELNNEDYLRTFRMVLFTMKVKYILYNGDLLTVDEFYSIKK